jgi:hypothetical protein
VRYWLTTPVAGTRPPLIGFVCPTEFCQRRRCRACWVNANPLCRYPDLCCSATRPRLDSEVSTPSPTVVQLRRTTDILSQALAPFQSMTNTSPLHAVASRQQSASAPSKVSSPSVFSQPQRATYSRLLPPNRLRCTLRLSQPLGALLPSRPAGPIPSRSHSWGLPYGVLLLLRCRTSFQTPCPSWLHLCMASQRLPCRDAHTTKRSDPGLEVSQVTEADCPLGLFRFEVSCHGRRRTFLALTRPLTRFTNLLAR